MERRLASSARASPPAVTSEEVWLKANNPMNAIFDPSEWRFRAQCPDRWHEWPSGLVVVSFEWPS
jgi:hypothetical protein